VLKRHCWWWSFSLLLVLVLVFTATACQSTSQTLATPPPPQFPSLLSPSAASGVQPASITANSAAPVPSPSPIQQSPSSTPVSPVASPSTSTVVAAAALKINSNTAQVTFPDKISFSLKGYSSAAIKTVSLEYGTDAHTLTPESNITKVDFKQNSDVVVNWDWQMKKNGSIPPGVNVWWEWHLTDLNDKELTVDRQSLVYTDTRYSWQVKKMPDMDLYWNIKDADLMNKLTDALQTHLARVQLNVSIPPERKPRIFVYNSSDELRGAVLFTQDWTGAMAYPSFNIILTAVNSSNLNWAIGALPHEVTHLLVGEAVFGPFGDLPEWLNEGMAKYSEGALADYLQSRLDAAVKNNKLISLRSLASSFPTDSEGAYLAYAESASVVNYMIQNYGWEKMRALLAVFKEGATYDKALLQVYQLDVNGLDAAWRASLKK
jgi:hypothetical protein